MIVVDASHLLIATPKGLWKITESQVIKRSFEGLSVTGICNIIDSVYLLSFEEVSRMCVWNEQTN
jgi:hypothetical protein